MTPRDGAILLANLIPPATELDHVDYWAVDWEHCPPVFRHRWHALRGRNGAPAQEAPLPERRGRCAVRIIDAWGEETTVLLEPGGTP